MPRPAAPGAVCDRRLNSSHAVPFNRTSRADLWNRASSAVLLASLALAVLPAVARAQGFHSVFSPDGTDAWAVGDGGIYYRSLDGGLSWASGSLGPSRLRDVAARGLNVVVVGDSGKIWRSTNSGGAWALTVVTGTPELRAVALPTALVGYAVGAAGTILKTVDGGGTWGAQVSGTASRLNAVRFTDGQNGWVVGENGTVLRTIDGGASWTPVSVGTTNALYAVDQLDELVWVVGARGAAVHSTDGGTIWGGVNLRLQDSGSEVRAVCLRAPDSVYIAGGGGFIRRSVDGGQSWYYPVHGMHGQISDLCFAGGVGFAASNRNRIVMSTIDQGTTWRLPTGATLARSWVLKLPNPTFLTAVGNGFGFSGRNPGTIYCGFGNLVFKSLDEGETWTSFATIPNCNRVHTFIVSPRDSNVFVAAVAGAAPSAQGKVVRSVDHGLNWTLTLGHTFGRYGIPLEYDRDRPDTMYFGGDSDKLFRSTDGGVTWAAWSITDFRSPCDLVVVPDSGNVILLGDGITNSSTPADYFKSSDGGLHFTKIMSHPFASEIPGFSNCRLRNSVSFGMNWTLWGGAYRTTDYGSTWSPVSTTSYTWGTDIARDDPNVVIYGVYTGGETHLSLNGGASFDSTEMDVMSAANYAFFARDRGLILAEQSDGIHKMSFNYSYTPSSAQSIALASPMGGQTWAEGSAHDITWFATNVALARIEYRRAPGEAWELVAEVPGYDERYSWTIPAGMTTEAKIRIRDAWDGAPEDSSDAFSIISPLAVEERRPPSFSLWQNRPNPFTRTTEIRYALPSESQVTLDVFDLQGHRVATLARGWQAAGPHSVTFGPATRGPGGRRLAPGVYLYRIQAGGYAGTRKMLLLD